MSLPQTSVLDAPARGVVGMIARGDEKQRVTRIANGICYPGRWVTFSGDDCAHPSAIPAAGATGGVVIKNDATEDGSYPDNTPVAILTEGSIFVDPEASVTRDTPAWARYVVNTTEKKGEFRGNAGNATGGVTFTVNTAENGEMYTITLDGIEFNYLSDGTATTAEIATGLATQIDAHATYVATNPTSTTILVVRASAVGDPIVVTAYDARLSKTANTDAFKVPAIFRSTGSGIVELEVAARAA